MRASITSISTTSIPLFAQYYSYSVNIDYLKKGDASEAFAYPGRKDEAFLKGEWEWLQLKGWGTRHFRPIFTDIDGDGDFNGPGYWSMDWKLSLSPSIGIWATDLTATIHKQWLDMENSHCNTGLLVQEIEK